MMLLISLPIALTAAQTESGGSNQADQAVIESCETEGVSMGFEGEELKAYIEECVVDFLETTIDVTPVRGSQ
jgi:hypothetical protein